MLYTSWVTIISINIMIGGEVFIIIAKNKMKILNIVNVVFVALSTFFFIKEVKKVGTEQVDFIFIGFYVLIVILAIINVVMYLRNKRDGIYN